MWQLIEQTLAEATGEPFRIRSTRAVTGGCINDAWHLQGDQRSFFVKINRAERLPMFEAEAAGLTAIIASNSLRAPRPVAWGVADEHCWLAMEFIEFTSACARTDALLGEGLAAMHRHTSPAFGWECDNTIGSTPQPNPATADWISFFREQRLGFQLALAARNKASPSLLHLGQQLLAELPALFGNYRPPASLLHGDLWGGNWGADSRGMPVIFDPAVYFGDREADLAMTELFGSFSRDFYAAYNAAWPLDPGYSARKRLYNLYHILNHFNLFGGSYAQQAEHMLKQILADLTL